MKIENDLRGLNILLIIEMFPCFFFFFISSDVDDGDNIDGFVLDIHT